ncbi:arsenite efflux transporter metallochaperone ArsD [Clostridium sp. CMCC3677]|uniref:arsenite efflux transporter metallochaperone ArsD n=1 Tax=Clostridium sp. CMCC3677 TaxID=2949963 RepID=UPI0013F133B8|nr:arsenite efflux transporter metallochaperone ArsD [Clostridium sp. CMCC3677]NFG61713.1 arsenite efflux transporter metallochaperone ArsD [Clostridium botulinum]NFQ08498.1 arsenite efflux transporter metallochaperone ArsD [Clostridium botulinum]
MKKMIIFDPAMCCSTGVCGPSVNPELLRVATVLNTLKNKGIIVERHNLTSNPQIFVTNKIINEMLMTKGLEALPIIMVNGKIVKMGSYPSNKEFCQLLNIPEDYLKANIKRPTKCNCKGGCC